MIFRRCSMASTYRRRFGDRKEGRQLRSLSPFYKFIPYIMPTRNDATNLYEESMEVTEVDRRLRRLRGFRPDPGYVVAEDDGRMGDGAYPGGRG